MTEVGADDVGPLVGVRVEGEAEGPWKQRVRIPPWEITHEALNKWPLQRKNLAKLLSHIACSPMRRLEHTMRTAKGKLTLTEVRMLFTLTVVGMFVLLR